MTQREQTALLLRKAADDELLVDRILNDKDVSDELIGFIASRQSRK